MNFIAKYNLKSNILYIIKNIGHLLISSLFVNFINFFFKLYVIENTSIILYGKFTLSIAILSLLSLFSLNSTNDMIIPEVLKKNHSIFRKFLIFKIKIITFVVILTFFLLILDIFVFNMVQYTNFIFTAIIFAIPFYALNTSNMYFVARKKYNIIALVNSSRVILFIIVSVTFFQELTLFGLFFSYLFSYALINFISFFYVWQKLKNDVKETTESMLPYKKLWNMFLLDAFRIFFSQIDKFIISIIDGYSTLGIYSLIISITSVFKNLCKLFVQVMTPVFASYKTLSSFIYINRIKIIFQVIITTVIASIIFFSFAYLAEYVPVQYRKALLYSRYVIFFILTMQSLNLMMNKLLVIFKHLRVYSQIIICSVVFRSVFLLALGFFYGLKGVLIVTCLTILFKFLISVFILGRHFNFKGVGNEIK